MNWTLGWLLNHTVAIRGHPHFIFRKRVGSGFFIANLRFSVSRGVCRDTMFDPCVASDDLPNSFKLLGHVLDLEKPDLVVFTGDQLNGQGMSWVVTDRKIPCLETTTKKMGTSWPSSSG
ncbi:hypothetical protein OG21DRAFT_636011 [Imleria badia]|nr:hypothetical protein OG21DRAFT_636011 [Imleria badia]